MNLFLGPSGVAFLGALLTAFGAILAGVGVFWGAQQKANFEHNLRKKSDEIAAKSNEIAELNREIANLVTGGDGFCYLAIANLDPSTNQGFLTFVNKCKYPLFDINARIVDLQEFRETNDLLLSDVIRNIDIIPARKAHFETTPIAFGDSKKISFNIFFQHGIVVLHNC